MAYTTPSPGRYRGDEILAVSSTAVSFAAVPDGTNFCQLRVVGNDIRMRANGTAPTSAAGQLLKADEIFEWPGDPETMQFIRVTADATIDAAFYKI